MSSHVSVIDEGVSRWTLDPSIYAALGKVNPHQSPDALRVFFDILNQYLPIKLVTLWRINLFANVVYPIIRLESDPLLTDTHEYIHKFQGDLLQQVYDHLITSSASFWTTENLQTSHLYKYHQSKDRVKRLNLKRWYCVPFRNFHASPKQAKYAGLLSLYVEDDVDLDSGFLGFLSSRISEIYSTQFVVLKDRISDAMLHIFGGGITKENSKQILERIVKEVCTPLLRAEAASIYEWDSHRFSYTIAATTGLVGVSSTSTPAIIEHAAEKMKPVLFNDLLNKEEVERQTGEVFDLEVLKENLEVTANAAASALILPIINPAADDDSKPIAIVRLLNKRPHLGAAPVFFDFDDVLLLEEVGRILALYEEQVRLSRSREAFALLFGHEAQAPASGIRGTADRLMMRIHKQDIDPHRMLSLIQDIFDFADLIVSFAESLNFGFAKSSARASRFNPRVVNLRNPIEAAKKVVIPICRYERLSFDALKIVGNYPDVFIDQRAVMQVFYNFFTNAIKYRRRGESDEFSVFVRGSIKTADIISSLLPDNPRGTLYTKVSGLFVEVGDYGMGIEPAYARKIFSEGFRAPEMGKFEIRGSGIGLSVVHNILNVACTRFD